MAQRTVKTGNKISIMMADDHQSARQSYARVLEDEDNMKVIGQAGNGRELLDMIAHKQPDIVILDLEMPVLNGYETLVIIREKFPKVKTIILTSHNEQVYISQLLITGARAYLAKDCSIEDMVSTVNNVHRDGYSFSRPMSQLVANTLVNEQQNSVFKHLLSEQEIVVLKHICEGKSLDDIAEIEGIEAYRLELLQQNIYTKTNSGSLAALLKYAIRNGITGID